jgi:spore germination protein
MKTDIYVVEPRDTPVSIACKLGIPVTRLIDLNALPPSEPLVVGQALLVPRKRKLIESFGYFQLYNLDDLEGTLAEIGRFFSLGGLFEFPVTSGGAFVIPEGVDVDRAVALLRFYQIRPQMTITNLTATGFSRDLARAVIGDPAVKDLVIRNLRFLLRRYRFSGVNVDFEMVDPEDQELFSDFIRDLKIALGPAGYEVIATVPVKNSDDPTNPNAGAYDYRALGQWADLVFIMAYDWGYMGGPPRAVAPIDEIRKALAYAVTQIPPAKIIQGIPLYGYNWQLPYEPGNRTTRAVNLVAAINLARQHRAEIQYDPTAQSPYFRYTDENGAEHIVWFEDARSVRAKYEAARDFNLGGVGFWSGRNAPYGFRQNWEIFDGLFEVRRPNPCDLQGQNPVPR